MQGGVQTGRIDLIVYQQQFNHTHNTIGDPIFTPVLIVEGKRAGHNLNDVSTLRPKWIYPLMQDWK